MHTTAPAALVTGSTSGIGRAVALALAANGFTILVHGRDAERGAVVVDQIHADGGDASFLQADLTDEVEVRQLAAEAGEIEVLVNNGGASWFGATAELDANTYDSLWTGNVRAAYQLVAALAPGMAERGHGSIINIGSMAGEIGLAGGAAYGATKGALSTLTRSWAAEFSPAGVRVNTVAPGPVYSAESKRELIDSLAGTTLLGRGAQPDEIAHVVAFLASEKASYITGALIAVDGGRIAV